jgi:cytochrome P450
MEDVFSDPFRFRPARFIERPESARMLGLFGSGPHTCLGQPLARIQETLAIAHIAANYDVAFTERPSLEAKFEGVTTPLQASVQARLVRRRA